MRRTVLGLNSYLILIIEILAGSGREGLLKALSFTI
jgi:hypothetical protein